MTTSTKSTSMLSSLQAWLLGLLMLLYTVWGRQHETLFVQSVILLVLCAWWVWKVSRRRGLPRSPLSLPLAAMAGVAVLSTLFSVAPRLSLTASLRTLTLVLFFFVACDLLLAGWARGTLLSAILIHAGLVIAFGLLFVIAWHTIWWQLRVPEYPVFLLPYRLYGLADHPIQLVSLVSLALPLAIIRFDEARRPSRRLLYGLWLLGAEVVLFYTRSRGGWAGAGISVTIAVGWLLWQRRPARLGDLRAWVRNGWRTGLTAAAYLALFAALFAFDARASTSDYNTNGGSISELAGRPLTWRVAWNAFLARPLTGSGVGTFPYVDVEARGVTTGWTNPHAHNLVLDTLAEEGILGLVALAWVMAVAGWALFTGWRQAAKQPDALQRRALLVAVAAALLASLVHTQVDIPYRLPTNALVVLLLLAVALQTAGLLNQGRAELTRWRALALIAPLALVFVLARQDAGRMALQQGVAVAGAGDWPTAAQALEAAVATDPNLSFYWAQMGYAYGMVAGDSSGAGASDALQRALASYVAARAAGPQYAPDLLNTSWLLERAGDTAEAEAMLAAAADRGSWWLPKIVLANRDAAEGDSAAAAALYTEVLERTPAVSETAACRQSAACLEAAARTPVAANPIGEIDQRARALLAQGRAQDALIALQSVPISNRSVLPWLDRADAHVMLGQLAEARYALTVVDVIGGEATRSALSHAALSLAEGSVADAITALELAARPQPSYVPYDGVVFGRSGLPGTLLPGLDLLERTPDDLAVYRKLAQLYDQVGRADNAAWAESQAATLAGLLGEPVD